MLDHTRAVDHIEAVREAAGHSRSRRFAARAERAQRAWLAQLGHRRSPLGAGVEQGMAAVGEPGSGPTDRPAAQT